MLGLKLKNNIFPSLAPMLACIFNFDFNTSNFLCHMTEIKCVSLIRASKTCSILGSSQYKLLSQLPLKTMLNLKVVKIDSKIILSLC